MFKLLMAGGVALALSASFASAATYVFDYTKNDRNIDVHGYGAIDFSDMTVSNKIGQDRYESNATRLGFRGDDNNVQNYYTTTGFSGFSGASEMSLRDPSHFNGQAMGFIAFGNRAYISLDDDYELGAEMSFTGVILNREFYHLGLNFDDIIVFGTNRIVFSKNGEFSDKVLAALPELAASPEVAAVPLPGTLALMGVGLTVAGAAFRPKKRKA